MFRLTVQYETPADPAAFDEAYFGRHVPLCDGVPGLRAASFSKPSALGPGATPYLVAQLDFDDAEAFQAAMASPEMGAVAKDAETLAADRVMFIGEVQTS